ncbi:MULTISPECIES: hypothetical protein [unclassified Streptomyces]|uniref:hypothetical protein n=1 Tax=unclassified Streptomyces TaxID=2593676 RepID=UPI00352F5B66
MFRTATAPPASYPARAHPASTPPANSSRPSISTGSRSAPALSSSATNPSAALLVVRQDGRVPHRQRLLLPAVPGRPFRLRADWLDRVDPHGATARIRMR